MLEGKSNVVPYLMGKTQGLAEQGGNSTGAHEDMSGGRSTSGLEEEVLMIQSESPQIVDTTTALRVQMVCDPGTFAALHKEWEALLSRVPRATAFQSPDWLAIWWRHLGDGNQLRLLLVRDAGDTLVGLVPLQLKQFGVWPVRLRLLRWLGHCNAGLTDTLGPIFAAGYETAALRAALNYLHQNERDWDLLALARTPDQLTQEIANWARNFGYSAEIFYPVSWLYIRLSEDWSSLQRTLSKNLRSNLPRYRNRLHREGYSESLVVLTEPEAIMAALPRFFELHQLRAQAKNMKQHRNYFASPASRAFVLEVARLLSTQKRLALAQMVVDGTVVAAQLLLFQEQVMSAFFSGFDPAWGRYGVMMQTMKASVEFAIAQGMHWVDLTAGDTQAKYQWGNKEEFAAYVSVSRFSPAGILGAWATRKRYELRKLLYEMQVRKTQRMAGPAE